MMPMGSRPSKNEMKIEGKIRPVERVRIISLRLSVNERETPLCFALFFYRLIPRYFLSQSLDILQRLATAFFSASAYNSGKIDAEDDT